MKLEESSEEMDTTSSRAEPDQSQANSEGVAEPSVKGGPEQD